MPSRGYQITIGLLLLFIIGGLIAFLYASYIGFFDPPFVSAAATSGLVLVTAVSVILTISLLNEHRKTRQQDIIPVFKLQIKPISIGKSGIVARNIGNGPAQNIDITVTIYPQNSEHFLKYPNVAEGDVIPIGNPFEDHIEFENVEKITVSGDCEDVMGEDHLINDRHTIRETSTDEYLLNRNDDEKYLKDLAKETKKIRQELKKIRGK